MNVFKHEPRTPIDQKDIATQKLIMNRAWKTMTHEIVHMFGVRHCIVHECLMNGTNKMQEGDLKPFLLCPVCLRKMHYAIGFDIKERYLALKSVIELEFESNHHFTNHLMTLNNIIDHWDVNITDEEIDIGFNNFLNNTETPILVRNPKSAKRERIKEKPLEQLSHKPSTRALNTDNKDLEL